MEQTKEQDKVMCHKCAMEGPRLKPGSVVRCPRCGTAQRVTEPPAPFCEVIGPVELAMIETREQAGRQAMARVGSTGLRPNGNPFGRRR